MSVVIPPNNNRAPQSFRNRTQPNNQPLTGGFAVPLHSTQETQPQQPSQPTQPVQTHQPIQTTYPPQVPQHPNPQVQPNQPYQPHQPYQGVQDQDQPFGQVDAGSNGANQYSAGVNFSVSGQNAQITVSQPTMPNENQSSQKTEEGRTYSPYSLQDILNVPNKLLLDRMIQQLQYTLKVAEAKRVLLEAEESLVGEVK